jgi:hypothetical protein
LLAPKGEVQEPGLAPASALRLMCETDR